MTQTQVEGQQPGGTARPQMTVKRALQHESRPVVASYLVALTIFLAATALASNFASVDNISNLLILAAFIGIAGIGQTFVLLGGGLDLSVPWIMTGSAILVSRLANGDNGTLWWAVPVTLLLACLVGLLNGIGVAKLQVSPIVMTLGVNGVVQGCVLLYTRGTGSPAAPTMIVSMAKNGIGPFAYMTMVWIALGVLAVIVLSRTSYGRRLYATGANPVVARLSGIRTPRVSISTYVISAFTGSLAGMLLLGYTATPFLSMGNPYLFTSIAAVAVGGTSILGGHGGYLGTVAGALVITLLGALLPILKLSQAALPIIYGVVILAAVSVASGRFAKTGA
jgi:ribose transport system permease protein